MPYRRPLGGGGSTPVQKFKFCSQRALKRSKMAKSSKVGLSPKFPRFSPFSSFFQWNCAVSAN